MKDDKPLQRQWQVLRLLCARRFGISIKELCEETGVGDKTIRRYLKDFQQVDFPLEEIKQEHGRKVWRMKNDGHLPSLTFAFDEAMAVYMGRRFLQPFAGTFFWQAAQQAYEKIRSCLSEHSVKYLEQMADRIYFPQIGISDYSQKGELLDQLTMAIEEPNQILLFYHSQSSTEPYAYQVYPLGLVYHKGSLYLVAHSLEHDQVRHFKFDRVHGMENSGLPFELPYEFDLDKHLDGSFGIFTGAGDIRVTVRFAPNVARYVQEKRWHPSEKFEPQSDGSVLGHFRLSAFEEFKSWLLSFGCHAVVVSPIHLREEMIAEVRKMAQAYEQISSPAPERSKRTGTRKSHRIRSADEALE